jgi:ribosomal-protein-alanine N-acetyltransferase
MNARVEDKALPVSLRPMREEDLSAIQMIEARAYEFPWTVGIFRDCLRAEYPAWVLYNDACIVGYFLMSVAAGEAHVLNICVAPEMQGQGYGRRLLHDLLKMARGRNVARVFLEVRPSNANAIALYHDEGFNEIGRRPRYYPAADGREDALVMAMELLSEE